jgi:lysophospholipase L1-like esterase
MRQRKRLLFALLPATLLVVGLEMAGRALPSQPIGFQGLIPHPERGWTLPASSRFEFGDHPVATNSLGLRSPEPGSDSKDRILVLGDSTPFGDGVGDDETFAARLAVLTQREVQNAGVPGYTCPQSLHRYRELADDLQPRWLIVYSLVNDARLLRGEDEAWLEATASGPGLLRLLRWTQLRRRIERQEPRVDLEDYASCLHTLAMEQRARGGATLLVVPVTMADFQNVPADQRGLPGRYRAALLRVAEDHDIAVLDLGQLDWAGFRPPDALMLDDVHPSAEGHARIAQRLSELNP